MYDYWSTKLFELDIKSMNYMELADWLIECRTLIKRENYDTYENYIDAVAGFCEEWEAFYQQHEATYGRNSVFHSEKFKKALLFSQLKNRYQIQLDFGEDIMDCSIDEIKNLGQSIFVQPTIKEIQQDFDSMYIYIHNIIKTEDGFKERLHDIISSQLFNMLRIRVRAFKDNGKQIKASSYKEALELCEKESQYTLTFDKKTKKVGYYKAFSEYNISISVYADYISPNNCEQEFNKKLFINLAFILCLGKTDAEKFLNYNGHTITHKTRQFDVICEKAFRIGFSREYVIALIDKFNHELKARYTVCKPMPNLTNTRKPSTIQQLTPDEAC